MNRKNVGFRKYVSTQPTNCWGNAVGKIPALQCPLPAPPRSAGRFWLSVKTYGVCLELHGGGEKDVGFRKYVSTQLTNCFIQSDNSTTLCLLLVRLVITVLDRYLVTILAERNFF
jgi:hypothetical protein